MIEALRLAELGYAVFPCASSKRPACPHGFQDACTDLELVAALWRRFPGPLIGIATGQASDLDVLDIDAKHGPARDWWAQCRSLLLPTRAYRTRSGGLHLWFRHRPGVRNTQGRICKGVDTRGEGGYVIFWGAWLPCLDASEPAPFPLWLEQLLQPRPPPEPVWRGPQAQDRVVAGIINKVAAASVGDRNGILFWAACRLAECGWQEADIVVSLLPASMAAGLSDSESRRTIRSAARR